MTSEKVLGKTPNGGDYSEIFYLDADNNAVEANKATHAIIRECTNDGRLVFETRCVVNESTDGQAV